MRIIYVGTMLYSIIFIKGKEDIGEINTTNLNDLNIYIRDIVAIFKLLLRLTP